jgi:hypothetical protein
VHNLHSPQSQNSFASQWAAFVQGFPFFSTEVCGRGFLQKGRVRRSGSGENRVLTSVWQDSWSEPAMAGFSE